MLDYINNMLASLDPDMDGVNATPATLYLFSMNPDGAELLDEDKAQVFHHYVAKSLFLCKRTRPDLQTTMLFLCTRVKVPDMDDYKKLCCMMQYICGTCGLVLMLEAESFQIIKWWVDISYVVHPDMKSHTGGAMSHGKEVVYGTYMRQKINTKSSTAVELVRAGDVLP